MNNKETNELIPTIENAVDETIERPYTLRRLKDKELYPILNIISTVFPDDLANVISQVMTKEKKIAEVGAVAIVRIIVSILKNMSKVQEDVYQLLSDVSGMTVEEIENAEFGTTPMMIWDIVSNEKNASFFKVVSKLS